MLKAFISYRSTDRPIVDGLVQALRATGMVDVWYDQKLVGGQSWWDEILKAIREADVVVLALSNTMLESEPCRLEYAYAQALNKPILPVQITPDLNISRLPASLSARQLLRFPFNPPTPLTDALALVTPVPLPSPLPTPPEAPLPPLAELREMLREPRLNHDLQKLAVSALEWHLADRTASAPEVRELADLLANRPDVTATVKAKAAALSKSAPPTPNLGLAAVAGIAVLILLAVVLLAMRPPDDQTGDTTTQAPTSVLANPLENATPTERPQADTTETARSETPESTAGPLQGAVIFEGQDGLTVLINGPADLANVTLRTTRGEIQLGDDFPLIAADPTAIQPGTCLRYLRANAQPPLARDCQPDAVFTLTLADSDVFWWDAVGGRGLDLVVQQGSDRTICPVSGPRCELD